LAQARGKAGSQSEAFLVLQKAMEARDRIEEARERSETSSPLAKVVPLLCPKSAAAAMHELARRDASASLLRWMPLVCAASAAQGNEGSNLLRESLTHCALDLLLSRIASVSLFAAHLRSREMGQALAIVRLCPHLNLPTSLRAI